MFHRNIALIAFLLIPLFHYGQSHSQIYDEVFSVNSRTKKNGIHRKVIAINVPYGAKGIYWSVSADKINTISAARAGREVLLHLITRKKKNGTLKSAGSGGMIDYVQSRYENINIYRLASRSDAENFIQTLNYDYDYYNKWEDVGHESRFISVAGGSTVYLGFHNTNLTIGLDIHLQVVAEY